MPGVKISINIKNLNGNQKVTSMLTDRIMFSKYVKFAKKYLRKEKTVDTSEVPTSFKLKNIKWLITDKIGSDDSVSVDLFVDTNYTEALQPTSFTASKNSAVSDLIWWKSWLWECI